MTITTQDRSDVMQLAWQIVRGSTYRVRWEGLRAVLADALRRAWSTIKARVAYRARIMAEAHRPSEEIRAELRNFENCDHLTASDHQRVDTLREALHAAQEREAVEAMEAKRDLITAAAGRFCNVTFTKKDGTERTMLVQPASLPLHVKGEEATEAGRRAAQTRKERHPHLFPVWDAEKRAIRSVNLATVTRIATGGTVHTYA